MFKNSKFEPREGESAAAALTRRSDEGMERLAEKCSLSDTQQKHVRLMADVVLTASRILLAAESGEPESKLKFARHVFKSREQLEEFFPLPLDRQPIFGFCLACDAKEEGNYTHCTHHDVHRMALLSIAFLNCVPPYDLDLEGDDDA